MEEEDKKAEARRVLDAIRQKNMPGQDENEKPPQAVFSTLKSEDAEQLKALVEQSRGIKKEIEEREREEEKNKELPDPQSINPISTAQIKVMRNHAAESKPKVEIKKTLCEALIKAYYDVLEFFNTAARANRCLLDGHRCLYCGKQIQEGSSPAALNSPASLDQQSVTRDEVYREIKSHKVHIKSKK